MEEMLNIMCTNWAHTEALRGQASVIDLIHDHYFKDGGGINENDALTIKCMLPTISRCILDMCDAIEDNVSKCEGIELNARKENVA